MSAFFTVPAMLFLGAGFAAQSQNDPQAREDEAVSEDPAAGGDVYAMDECSRLASGGNNDAEGGETGIKEDKRAAANSA